MKFQFYTGQKKQQPSERVTEIPPPQQGRFLDPSKYQADQKLADAANVALWLGQPLLLMGDPGTGKTEFASSLAWELGLDKPIKFETKSTSTARDLFYTYDALRRFQDVQNKDTSAEDVRRYLTYQALGKAILWSYEPDDSLIKSVITDDFKKNHPGKRRSVVLIDEVDKAPRDFPNDILNELERFYFLIPELENVRVDANKALAPIVIFTSNSEKDLPNAFLRRCVFFHIAFPKREQLKEIVTTHLEFEDGDYDDFLNDGLSFLELLRKPAQGLAKAPATAEFLNWMLVLRDYATSQPTPIRNPIQDKDIVDRTLGILVKTIEDQQTVKEILEEWPSALKA